jgi:16S rRNA (guanine966-N2)-methyltransferase
MRVIAGRYKGRRLATPTGSTSRPILDRVKVSLFDWLGSKLREPGRLPPISVCDLFCAAGSQGIEALSRGATFCAFVDKDRAAIACLRKNLDALGITKEAVIINQPAESVALGPLGGDGFDLVFVDPPYRLSEDVSAGSPASRIFAGLGTRIVTRPEALVLWRHDDKCTLPQAAPGGWTTTERRTWGSMAITMFQQSQVQA